VVCLNACAREAWKKGELIPLRDVALLVEVEEERDGGEEKENKKKEEKKENEKEKKEKGVEEGEYDEGEEAT
jgi:hypothetical protein